MIQLGLSLMEPGPAGRLRTGVLQCPRGMVSAEDSDARCDGIRWDLYPHVRAAPAARVFVVRLGQFSRRPKTIDAYARNLDRFLASFADASTARWVEADEGDLLSYV